MTSFFNHRELKERGIEPVLAGDPEGPVPAERRPWRRLALCCSGIAFAVVIRPDDGRWGDGKEEQAKTALYRYLRRIQLTLLEFGLVYPLVVIAIAEQETVTYAKMACWTSDQDWHRGDFTLFVESTMEKARERVIELLSLKVPRLMGERREPRTMQDHIREFESLLPETGRERELGQLVLDVWRLHEGRPFGDDHAREARMKLGDWITQRIADARRVVEDGAS